MADPTHPEDIAPKDRARVEADAFAEADELEIKNVEPVDTAALVEEKEKDQ